VEAYIPRHCALEQAVNQVNEMVENDTKKIKARSEESEK